MTTFTRSQTVPELYFLSEAVNQTLPHSIAFWVDEPEIQAHKNLTLESTWTTGKGIYLFLKAVPDGENGIDPSQLSDRIREFLRTPSVRNTCFLWIENPQQPVFRWRFYTLTLSSIDTVERLTFLNFRNYELAISPGIECRLNQTKDGFIFALNPDLHNLPHTEAEPGKSDPFYFSTNYGAQRLKGIKVNENQEAITLPFTGALSGCLNFALTLQNLAPGNQPFEELIQMDVALRMFFKSANLALDPTDLFSGFADLNTDEKFLISSHRYPFFGEDRDATSHYSQQEDRQQNLTLYATLDPLRPLNGDRTYFAFVESGNSKISEHSFPSCYRTNLGYTIHLTPHGHNDSKLIFAERLSQSSSEFEAPFYLVPTGKYTLSVPDYQTTPIPNGKNFPIRDEDNFLCGLAGIEYIQLSSQHTNILHLNPGQPAFAPDFIPDQIVENDQTQQRLESRVTTAWAYIEYVEAANFPIYFSQPQQSLLYRASTFQDQDQNATNNPLRFLEVPVTELPRQEYLPLFPYGGVSGRLTHYQQMEEQLLNPQRRQKIRILSQRNNAPVMAEATTIQETETFSPVRVMAANTDVGVSITGTTPQGLLATYSSDYETLNTLLLAKDTGGKNLSLQALERRSNLRLAFQSNQMFLVVTNPDSLKNYFPENKLTIQGWTFDLDPNNWRTNQGDTDTVLIFKFRDKPLLEILKDLALWEQPNIFVSDPNLENQTPENQTQQIKAVRDRLVNFFQKAIDTEKDANASEKDRDNAAPLARVGSSTFWSGFIALNVALPAGEGLPEDLKALECGIQDGENFYAQYVGSNGTPILPKEGELEAEQSSLFGLLDYQDTSVPKTGSSGYAFQVASLRVQFQNSQIIGFSSEVNLTLDRLFDEATQLLNSRSGRNIVILKGFTENHNGIITYAFSFSGENYFALPNSHILNTVDIVKATFSTDPPSKDSTIITGRFILWGRLNFRNLEELDGFSFGSEMSLSDVVLNASQNVNRSATALSEDYQGGIDTLKQAKEQLQTALDELAKNEQFLQFSKLEIVMNCQHTNAAESITFNVDYSQIGFDLDRSQARSHSLYSKFPLKLVNFVSLNPNQPNSQPKGYLPVKTAFGGSKMPTQGFGLNFELNLGSLGALAGVAQFVANLLIVWQPNSDSSQEKAQTFIGLRLPGIGGDVLGFPLQSVLKLSFKSVELIVDRSNLNPAYLLKIKKIALKFFVLSFPPNGQTEIVIFGNPDATDTNNTVGWYAAYAKEPAPLPEGQSSGRASPSKR